MTHASSVFISELQRSFMKRGDSNTKTAMSNEPPRRKLQHTVSAEAQNHLTRLRKYRNRAKSVRVGDY
jgi:hypothetical protein